MWRLMGEPQETACCSSSQPPPPESGFRTLSWGISLSTRMEPQDHILDSKMYRGNILLNPSIRPLLLQRVPQGQKPRRRYLGSAQGQTLWITAEVFGIYTHCSDAFTGYSSNLLYSRNSLLLTWILPASTSTGAVQSLWVRQKTVLL